MDENAIDKVVTICIAAGVGAILVCSFVLPIFADMLGTLTTEGEDAIYDEDMKSDVDTWKTLLGVVAMVVIVAFMVAIVRSMTSKSRRRLHRECDKVCLILQETSVKLRWKPS